MALGKLVQSWEEFVSHLNNSKKEVIDNTTKYHFYTWNIKIIIQHYPGHIDAYVEMEEEQKPQVQLFLPDTPDEEVLMYYIKKLICQGHLLKDSK